MTDLKQISESADFIESERGTDCEFHKLPKEAKEIAFRIIEQVNESPDDNKQNLLTKLLDRDLGFRDAIGVTDLDVWPKQVDAVCRFHKYGCDHARN